MRERDMYRSASTTRVSEEFFPVSSPSSKPSPGLRTTVESDELPMYDPLSNAGKKERANLKFAENAVHVIPFVLALCAVILWFFSKPVDMVNKDDSIMSRIEGLTIDGDMDTDISQAGLELEDFDPQKHMENLKAANFLRNRFN